MSKRIEFPDYGFKQHKCTSKREGDWIIFTCPDCDYVRRFNVKTGETTVKGGDMTTLHSGGHTPEAVQLKSINPN